MTEIERLMYQILGKVSSSGAPLVFKGALITKLVLTESGFTALERHTRDIDANWVGTPPTMDDIVTTVNQSLGDLHDQFYAEAFREYGEKMSAGISIRERETGKETVRMDIDMRPIAGSRLYHYGDTVIRGILVNEILADKITVISKKLIFRRAKDLIDVYALANCVSVQSDEIFRLFGVSSRRELGGFDEFYTRRQDLEHAYGRLMGVEKKPPFADVYTLVERFILPFAQRNETPGIWEHDKLEWVNR